MNSLFIHSLLLSFVLSLAACSGGDDTAVTGGNAAPVASAGTDSNVFTGDTVILDGSGSSDTDGDTLTYQWSLQTIPAGSAAFLSSATAEKPSFVADLDGPYIASLIVNDGTVDSAADTVTATASATANTAPTADAGTDANVVTGLTVTLDGSGSSDTDGDTLTYQWSLQKKPAGSAAFLFSVTAESPSFLADLDGTYIASLTVNDGTVDSAADTVTITASAAANNAPTADAGTDFNVFTGDLVILDGSGSSDADSDILTFQWSLQSIPAGSTASLSSATAERPAFVADLDGTYTASLIVNDGTVDSAADTVTVTVSATNTPPTADAGADQNVTSGATVTLDGSGSSDADNDTLTYQWSILIKPAGSAAFLSSATAESPSFVADLDGTYTASLIVNDGTVDSAADTVTVTASASNTPPTADAGADQVVSADDTVTLDGSGSSDAEGNTLKYQWRIETKPAGSLLTSLSSATAESPTFFADAAGDYTISLVVNDGSVNSVPDTVLVTATIIAGQTKYDADCGSCHAAGSYDTTTTISKNYDLYDKGELLITNISSYSPKKSSVVDLTPQEIFDLNAFLEDPSIKP